MKINNYDFTFGVQAKVFTKYDGKLINPNNALPINIKGLKGSLETEGVYLKATLDNFATESGFSNNIEKLVMSPYTNFNTTENIIPSLSLLEPTWVKGAYDYNAYTGKAIPQKNPFDTSLRHSDGNLVINWIKDEDPLDSGHLEACFWLSQILDHYLGLVSIFWDDDHRRRQAYPAGTFQPTSSGMVYKVLSSMWLQKPWLRSLVFNNTVDAIISLFEDNDKIRNTTYAGKTAATIINTFDVKSIANCIGYYSHIRTPKWYREHLGLPVEEI